MKKVILILIISISSLLFAETNLQKTDIVDTTKTRKIDYVLEGISVIAQRVEQSIGSIDVKNYNPQQINMEIDVSEALADISGLNLNVAGKDGSELSIRGFSEEQIKIMIDGRPLSNGYMDAVDLTTIPLTNIKEIQILKGPISALYGSNTMGGVVNIITKSPSKKRELIIGSQLRRNNTFKLYSQISQNLGLFDYSLSASGFHTDGFMLSQKFIPAFSQTNLQRNRNASTQYDLQSKINFQLFDFHKIGLQFGYTNMPTKELMSSIYEKIYRQYTDWNHYQTSLSGFFQLRYNLEYNTQLYFDKFADTYVEYSDEYFTQIKPRYPSELKSWTIGSNNSFNWEINEITKITNGIRFEESGYDRRDNGSYLTWTSNSTKQINYSLQSETNLKKINLTFGSGLSWFNLNTNNNWKYHFQPAGGIYYTSEKNLKISLASGINSTYPTLRQLFSSSSGNESLKEESAWKTEINCTKPFVVGITSGNLTGAIFYNKVINLIDRIGDLNVNIDEVESYGFEINTKIKLGWEHKLEYSYLKYSQKSDAMLIGTPQNSISVIEYFTLPFDIKFSYSAHWKDERLTEYSTIILEPYWLHSINLQKKFGNYKLALGLNNLFDNNYQDPYGYPSEGFNFMLNFEKKI